MTTKACPMNLLFILNLDFPGTSDGKEFVSNAGHKGSTT